MYRSRLGKNLDEITLNYVSSISDDSDIAFYDIIGSEAHVIMLYEKKLITKNEAKKIVFTNGCFDLVHRGHVEVLANTADLGDRLIIGLNSDTSIHKLKGEKRPVIDENSRAILLASLQFIDAIVLFSEATPYQLIEAILPDILAIAIVLSCYGR